MLSFPILNMIGFVSAMISIIVPLFEIITFHFRRTGRDRISEWLHFLFLLFSMLNAIFTVLGQPIVQCDARGLMVLSAPFWQWQSKQIRTWIMAIWAGSHLSSVVALLVYHQYSRNNEKRFASNALNQNIRKIEEKNFPRIYPSIIVFVMTTWSAYFFLDLRQYAVVLQENFTVFNETNEISNDTDLIGIGIVYTDPKTYFGALAVPGLIAGISFFYFGISFIVMERLFCSTRAILNTPPNVSKEQIMLKCKITSEHITPILLNAVPTGIVLGVAVFRRETEIPVELLPSIQMMNAPIICLGQQIFNAEIKRARANFLMALKSTLLAPLTFIRHLFQMQLRGGQNQAPEMVNLEMAAMNGPSVRTLDTIVEE